jgi:hypothetical protein
MGLRGAARPGALRPAQKAGKKARVILVAIARKLVVLANAVLRDGKPWQPELSASR